MQGEKWLADTKKHTGPAAQRPPKRRIRHDGTRNERMPGRAHPGASKYRSERMRHRHRNATERPPLTTTAPTAGPSDVELPAIERPNENRRASKRRTTSRTATLRPAGRAQRSGPARTKAHGVHETHGHSSPVRPVPQTVNRSGRRQRSTRRLRAAPTAPDSRAGTAYAPAGGHAAKTAPRPASA